MIKKIAFIFSVCLAASSLAVASDEVIPMTKSVAPAYPQSALERKHTGWAVVEYSVNKKGRATNVVITDSEPANVFDRAAKKAILQSRFEIPTVDGEAVKIDKQVRKFVFEIDEEIPGEVASRRR